MTERALVIDGKKPFKVLGDTWKTTGNSAPGRMGINKAKFKKSVFCDARGLAMLQTHIDYHSHEQLSEDYFQCTRLKRRCEWDTTVQIYVAVYQLAKLEILKFTFDFLYKVLDPLKFETCHTDTDCLSIAITEETFEECVKDQELYDKLKHQYFPRTSTKLSHHVTFQGTTYPISIAAADKRKPHMWKVESVGDFIAAVGPKCVLIELLEKHNKNKFAEIGLKLSLKGCMKDNYGLLAKWNAETIKNDFIGLILGQKRVIESINKGFQIRKDDQRMVTIQQRKDVASFWYDKTILLPDCRHLDLSVL